MKLVTSMKSLVLGVMVFSTNLALSQQAQQPPAPAPVQEAQAPNRPEVAGPGARPALTPARPAASVNQLNLQQERRGGSEGNGGDGVFEDGELVLRDLSRSQMQLVPNNKRYLESHTGFIDLVLELAAISPYFAKSVWMQLEEAQIWLTPETLPILPSNATGIGRRNAEVQVAIRTGRQIIISLPALEQLSSPFEYVLLHEALHGIINTSTAMGHESVRALVRFISESRGNFNREDFFAIARSLRSPMLEDTSDRWFIPGSRIRVTALNQLFLTDGGRSPEVCSLYGAVKEMMIPGSRTQVGPYYYSYVWAYYNYVPSSWGQLANCPGRALSWSEIFARFPELRIAKKYQSEFVEGRLDRSRLSRDNRQRFLDFCKSKANAAAITSLETDFAEALRLRGVRDSMISEFSNRSDKDAIIAFVYMAIIHTDRYYGYELFVTSDSDERSSDSVDRVIRSLESSIPAARANIQTCTQIFGANYMTRTRP
jgi:hypothetical protein